MDITFVRNKGKLLAIWFLIALFIPIVGAVLIAFDIISVFNAFLIVFIDVYAFVLLMFANDAIKN